MYCSVPALIHDTSLHYVGQLLAWYSGRKQVNLKWKWLSIDCPCYLEQGSATSQKCAISPGVECYFWPPPQNDKTGTSSNNYAICFTFLVSLLLSYIFVFWMFILFTFWAYFCIFHFLALSLFIHGPSFFQHSDPCHILGTPAFLAHCVPLSFIIQHWPLILEILPFLPQNLTFLT